MERFNKFKCKIDEFRNNQIPDYNSYSIDNKSNNKYSMLYVNQSYQNDNQEEEFNRLDREQVDEMTSDYISVTNEQKQQINNMVCNQFSSKIKKEIES